MKINQDNAYWRPLGLALPSACDAGFLDHPVAPTYFIQVTVQIFYPHKSFKKSFILLYFSS